MNLLIVDDNPNQLFSLSVALKTKGHSVTLAGSGREALEHLRNNHPLIDVVLTDYAMPGMTGLELLEEISREFEFLPVILMTAYGKKEIVVAALQNGCAGYVEKPFTIDQLMPELERVLSVALEKMRVAEFTTQIREQVAAMNDKLTIIAGGAEIALLDLEKENLSPVRDQLRDITLVAHDIGVSNELMLKRMMACKAADAAIKRK